MNAEFMDIFGLIGFAILLFSGIKVLKSKDKKIKKYGMIIIAISLLGIVIDGYIVIKTFIIGG